MTKKSSTVRKSIKNPPVSKDNVQVIKQVWGLAWAGEHTQAIELASQQLSASTSKLAEQLDLLDLRAESYVAQGKFDLAAKDANAMVKLAKGGNRELGNRSLKSSVENQTVPVQVYSVRTGL